MALRWGVTGVGGGAWDDRVGSGSDVEVGLRGDLGDGGWEKGEMTETFISGRSSEADIISASLAAPEGLNASESTWLSVASSLAG